MHEEIITFAVAPVVDTSIYAANDLLWDTIEVTTLPQLLGRTGYIAAVTINDKDDEKAALDIVFLRENRDAGTINSAPTITDAHSDDTLGVVNIATTDYRDVGGNSQVSMEGLNIPFGREGTGIYCYAVNGSGTPTYTAASDLTVKVRCHIYS